MTRFLRALLVQRADPAGRLLRELERVGYDLVPERVVDERAFRAALDRDWDVVLSDWRLPNFGAPEALAVLRRLGRDVPLVVVSDKVGEEVAADAFAFGARDVIEIARPARLGAVIERELREAARRAEHRGLQARLEASERLALVGAVAADLAHEVRNPLTAVVANVDVALEQLGTLEQVSRLAGPARALRATLRTAQEAAARIGTIVSDVSDVCRADPEVRPVDPISVTEAALRVASSLIRSRARVISAYGDTPPVLAAEATLGQVLLNLVLNAAQALHEDDAARNVIRVATRCDGVDVVIEVSDNGAGIAPEVMNQLFTPFVTTKPSGAGLGLSISRRLVTRLGGRISVTSTGGWTTFSVALPAAEHPAAARRARS